MRTSPSFAELNQIAGEVLPERAVLSTVTPFRGSDGPTVVSTCTTAVTPYSLITTLLAELTGSAVPVTTITTCTPAAVAS